MRFSMKFTTNKDNAIHHTVFYCDNFVQFIKDIEQFKSKNCLYNDNILEIKQS